MQSRLSKLEAECIQLSGSQGELQRDVYELCELVLDMACNIASRGKWDLQARQDLATGRNTTDETRQRRAGREFVVRFNYDPFTMSPNDDPESELALRAGDLITVFGSIDSVSGVMSRRASLTVHVVHYDDQQK